MDVAYSHLGSGALLGVKMNWKTVCGWIGLIVIVLSSSARAQAPSPPTELTSWRSPPVGEEPLVVLSPTSTIVQYPSSADIARDRFRWEITFTVNSITNSLNGLVSRDEMGQAESGHITIRVLNGFVHVRHQDISTGAPTVEIQSTTAVKPGVEYQAVVSMDTAVGFGLFVNGALEARSDVAYGLSGNMLPLTLGGYCGTCNDTTPPSKPIDGVVGLKIYAEPWVLPAPKSVLLKIEPPTEFEDCDPEIPLEDQPRCGELLAPEYPDGIRIYKLNPRELLMTLPGDTTERLVEGLFPGEHCFVATALAGEGNESLDSNTMCYTIE